MKRNILLILVSAAAVVMGCSKQDDLVGAGGTSKKSITLSLDDLGSRAEVTDMSRYILEVYQGANADGTAVSHTEQGTSSFTIELTEGSEYTFLAWADYGAANNNTTGDYDAASLKAIKVITGKTPSKEAFGGKLSVTVDATASYDMTIKHSVAQVNFIQKEAFTAAANTLKVVLPKTYQLNLASGAATEILNATVSVPATYTFSGIGKVGAGVNIGTSYIVASTDAANKTLLDLKTTFNAEVTKDITSVPFTMNYRTNITGAYSNLYDSKVSSICEDAWDTPENDKEFPDAIPFQGAVGDFYYQDKSFSTVIDVNKTCIGVVGWVAANKLSYKVMSLYEILGGVDDCSSIEGINDTDGVSNTAKIVASGLSDGGFMVEISKMTEGGLKWYVPAINELTAISASKTVIQSALTTAGFVDTDNKAAVSMATVYMSSSIGDDDTFKMIDFTDGSIYNSGSTVDSGGFGIALIEQ